ncbi:MAG: hypothetical protein ABIZ81_09545 [Opitutaceae bacterium]
MSQVLLAKTRSMIPTPKEIEELAAQHPQTSPNACTSWGVEMLFRIHGKELPQHYQETHPNGCGFGEEVRAALRAGLGFPVIDPTFGDDFGKFERNVLASIRMGFFPIFIFPSYFHFDRTDEKMVLAHHTFVTYEEAGSLKFVTRGFRDGGPMHYTMNQFEKMRYSWTPYVSKLGCEEDLLLHTLLPESIQLE